MKLVDYFVYFLLFFLAGAAVIDFIKGDAPDLVYLGVFTYWFIFVFKGDILSIERRLEKLEEKDE